MAKSGSESSISEACDNAGEQTKPDNGSTQSSVIPNSELNNTQKEAQEVPRTNMSKRGSLTSAKSLHELKHEIEKPKRDIASDSKKGDEEPGATKGIRPSKSDTSLTESFVVIDNEYNKRKYQHVLREGKIKANKLWLV